MINIWKNKTPLNNDQYMEEQDTDQLIISLINTPPSHTGTDPLIASAPCVLNAIMFTSHRSLLTLPVKHMSADATFEAKLKMRINLTYHGSRWDGPLLELGGRGVKSYRMKLNDRRPTAHT